MGNKFLTVLDYIVESRPQSVRVLAAAVDIVTDSASSMM